MKKNRNSFFTESNMSYQGFNPTNNVMPQMMPQNMPYQAGTSYNSFIGGMYPNNYSVNNSSDIENRLAKIERQINRLDHRVSKLESGNTILSDDFDDNSNMYML